MGIKEDIGTRIKTMRLSRKMTQADLAKAIGQSASSITMYETGRREPEFEVLEAMSDVFNVPLSSFIAEDYGLAPDESRMLDAYRAADDTARQYALETLLNHPKKKDTASTAG